MFPLKSLTKTFLLLAILSSVHAEAREHRWTHFGLRPLGMGNAWVAVADDYNALFYNPAGLARLKSWDGEFLNPALEVSQKTLDIIKEIQGAGSNLFEDTSDALTFLQDHAGETHHFALALTPHFIMKNWGFGIGLNNHFSLVTHNTINIEVEGGLDAVVPFAFAQSFFEERLSVGASLKMRMQMGIDHSFTLQDLNLLSKNDGLKDLLIAGRGFGVDVGFLFTPMKPMEPTLGVSLVDVGGTSFDEIGSFGKVSRPPPVRRPAFNTGISLKPIQSGGMYLLTAVDAHILNQPVHYSHKLNLGLEFGYSEIIKLQLGLKEGYGTAGFQFDVGLLNIRMVTYAVDHAPLVGSHDKLFERRIALQLKLLI